MARGIFDPNFEDLPGLIPVFPLAGVLLLPQGHLPLQIFERRYLAMTRDALLAPTRLIGMIQPTGLADGPNGPELFPVGTAGRIINFAETDDGRYHIVLAGLIRFRVRDEVDLKDGYRRVMPNFLPYKDDLEICAIRATGASTATASSPGSSAISAPSMSRPIGMRSARWTIVRSSPRSP